MTATAAFDAGLRARADGLCRAVPLRLLAALLVGLLVLDNMLLLAFLGQPLWLAIPLCIAAPSVIGFLIYRSISPALQVGVRSVLLCFGVAAVLLILGGEGRLFYATADWQIRDAVLADMATHRWPFDYWLDGQVQMLRAPIGMYLLPALLGGASQAARDWVLALQNILFLGLLFSMGSMLLETARARAIALVVFVAFSGLDVIGNLLLDHVVGHADWDHLERWAGRLQYSAHITQLFWVPQHAFAGWTCALAYLLWRRDMVCVQLFGAIIPLVALWSPFALFGILPFALFAGVSTLVSGRSCRRDLLLCALSLAAALPSLLYLAADARSVGGGLYLPPLIVYIFLMLIEVAPFMAPLLLDRAPAADRPTLLIVALCLALMPLWLIGASNDFQMRASIVPLAIAAVAFGQWATRISRAGPRFYLLLVLALGSVTGATEIARAIRLAPSPPPLCSLPGSWVQQSGQVVPHNSYFAAEDKLPRWLIPTGSVERVPADPHKRCWQRPWRSDRPDMPRPANHPRTSLSSRKK